MTSCHWLTLLVQRLALERGEHAQRAMTSTAVVEDLKIFEHGVGEFDAGAPGAAVEQFGLHAPPERLDDGVVEALTG